MSSTASTALRTVIEWTWTDEHGVVHALFRLKNDKSGRSFLVCTGNILPRWGIDLAEQNTLDPATCLWCIAGEQKPKEKP